MACLLGESILSMLTSAITLAQDGTTASAGARVSGVEEVVVTAQRRSQNLQDVPVAVAAFSPEALERNGITNIADIAQLEPSVNMQAGSGVVTPFLRGIGNVGATVIGNEASVPVYIDDVYYTRLSPAYLDLANVQRVEVLKGPQGTLFGRNSVGGLINVVTRDPSATPTAELKVGYGNYQTVTGKMYVSGPISEGVAADLSVSARDQGQGWGKNFTTGNEAYRDRFVSVRSKLVAAPSETTEITGIGYYVREKSDIGINATRLYGTVSGTPAFYGPPQPIRQEDLGFYNTDNHEDNNVDHEGYGGSIKLVQDVGLADLVSISAYRHATEPYESSGTMTPYNFLSYVLNAVDRQFSEELQLRSQDDSTFDWIIGAYYLNSRQGFDPSEVSGDAVGPGNVVNIYGVQTIRSVAGYGQSTFPVFTDTKLTLGLRYTVDKVRGKGSQTLTIGALGATVPFTAALGGQDPYAETFTFKKPTYRVALDHQFSEDILGYASYSRGYKSGTFNTLPLFREPAKAEMLDAYEIGLKSTLFNRRLRVNLAIFENDVKDPQVLTIVNTQGLGVIGLTNAQKARIRGVEIETEAVLADGLNLRLAASYLDPKYTQFTNAPFSAPIVDANGVPTAPYGLGPQVLGDASGSQMARISKFRLAAGVDYGLTSAAGDFSFAVNAAYQSRFPWDPDQRVFQGRYTLVNGSISFTPESHDNLTLRIWGNNLTDKKYNINHLETNTPGEGDIAAPGAPRTYGAELSVAF